MLRGEILRPPNRWPTVPGAPRKHERAPSGARQGVVLLESNSGKRELDARRDGVIRAAQLRHRDEATGDDWRRPRFAVRDGLACAEEPRLERLGVHASRAVAPHFMTRAVEHDEVVRHRRGKLELESPVRRVGDVERELDALLDAHGEGRRDRLAVGVLHAFLRSAAAALRALRVRAAGEGDGASDEKGKGDAGTRLHQADHGGLGSVTNQTVGEVTHIQTTGQGRGSHISFVTSIT